MHNIICLCANRVCVVPNEAAVEPRERLHPEDLGTAYHNNIIINVERRPRNRDKHIGLMLCRLHKINSGLQFCFTISEAVRGSVQNSLYNCYSFSLPHS